VVLRQRGVAIDTGDFFHHRPGQPVVAIAGPVGERCDFAGELAVAVGAGQLALRKRHAAFLLLNRSITQHQVREIDIELVRWHIGALRHEAHVAERAGVGDLLKGGLWHAIQFAGRRGVDQVKEARKRVA
jgi:hypothetical protein